MTDRHPILAGSPYGGYVYAYPHKTAYRPLVLPRPLADVWAGEPRSSLSLYVHVPFCTMRCGFCNLFTTPNPTDSLTALYLDALRREADAVRAAVPDATFARFAIGGGTPTYLKEADLDAVFDIAGVDPRRVPTGVEVSPDTVTLGKVSLLKARGVSRVSVGIQSFVEAEAAASGRAQSRRDVDAALALLGGAGFPTLNLDLIYGLPGQTVSTWLASLREALTYSPTELFLYPLYVRPLTGLGRSRKAWDDERLALYRAGRDLLLEAGYAQVSMRMFRRGREPGGPSYCCQEDGMIGLGCGARSYTRSLHYSHEYAVGAKNVRAIIADYLARDADQLATASHGFALDADERRRRYVLQSILNADGLDAARYAAVFDTDPAADFPDLPAFADLGLLALADGRWVPTPLGLERSDALGPWFFSSRVRTRSGEYEPR
ncbi:STM4012 family radical SAM protein [Limnoglobus roseus]|uniref:STM4012 family radical SAM protein n=1 Tax=Limnoglobus roseus TaxID=2598579 RepID=UPI0036F33F05